MKAVKLLLQVISGKDGEVPFSDVPDHSIFHLVGFYILNFFHKIWKNTESAM